MSRARLPHSPCPPGPSPSPGPGKSSMTFHSRGSCAHTRGVRMPRQGASPPASQSHGEDRRDAHWLEPRPPCLAGSRWPGAALHKSTPQRCDPVPRARFAPRTLTVVLGRLEVRIRTGVGAGAGVGWARLGRLQPRAMRTGRAGGEKTRNSFSPEGRSRQYMPSGHRNTRSVSAQFLIQRVTQVPDPRTPGLRLTEALGPPRSQDTSLHSKCNEGT